MSNIPGSLCLGYDLIPVPDPLRWGVASTGLDEQSLSDCALPQVAGVRSSDRLLLGGEIAHWRTVAIALAAVRAGAWVVVLDSFCPRRAFGLLESQRITLSDWHSWQLAEILELPPGDRDFSRLTRLEAVWVGGARLSRDLKAGLSTCLGERVFEQFTALGWSGWCQADHQLWRANPDAVGHWFPNGGLKLLNPQGEELPGEVQDGQIGELVSTSPDSFSTHWLGYFDGSGAVVLQGTKSNALETEFGWLTPYEAERVLESHSAVTDAVLIKLDEPLAVSLGYGAGFYAVVKLSAEFSPGTPLIELELLDFCRSQLSEVKCPLGLLFVLHLPRLPGGRVDLGALRTLISAANLPVNTGR